MAFILIFVSILILCFFNKIQSGDNYIKNLNIKLDEPYLNIQNTTDTKNIRKLEESRPLKIKIDTTILERNLEEYEEEVNTIKKAIEDAKETIIKIIKIKTKISTNSINILDYVDKFESNTYKNLLNNKYKNQSIFDIDLLIFVRGKGNADTMKSFANIIKFETDENNYGRVLVGCIIYDYMKDFDNSEKINYTHRQYLLTVLFLHEFIHFLGFDNEILFNKHIINRGIITSRVKSNSFFSRYYVTNDIVVKYAKEYFDCDSITMLEFSREEQNEIEDLQNSHWEGRLFLGDIMTLDLYYPEQVISKFTLLLLDQLDWYEINYYTGGLMKFGKGQGCDFINKDCIDINNNQISFFNEFCENSFGTCSFGRQSRSYCSNEDITKASGYYSFVRNSYSKKYGINMVEYCPISIPINMEYSNYYYIGSCKIGNDEYGGGLTFFGDESNHKYSEFNQAFEENIGGNSFCALSSILKKDDDNNIYKNWVRPTCYEMLCSPKSLTIRIGSEYIVCPQLGGVVKVGGEYTKYVGYLFCPDYNLICAGTVLCNNLFDCINNKSEIKEGQNYNKNEIVYNSEEKTNNENEIDQNYSISNEGYELSEDGKCPVDCMQCLSFKRCILCGNSKNLYIGESDNNSSPINCTDKKPEIGYYNFSRDGHTHFFRCVDGCDVCENNSSCSQCAPEFYLSDDQTQCIERIPNCKDYDKDSKFKDPKNNNGDGYKYCLKCDNDNNYYCINNNKTSCDKVDDIKLYYEIDNKYHCFSRCADKFQNCSSCDSNTCFYCDPRFYFNDNNVCTERIPNCKTYKESSKYTDYSTNKGGDGYKECEICEDKHYCIQDNKAICQYIETLNPGYYEYGNGCYDTCENKFTFVCLDCDFDKCINCATRHKKSDENQCVEGIHNCKIYDSEHGNDTYIECLKCNEEEGFLCYKDMRTVCINANISLYYKLEPSNNYSCYNKCDDKYIGCETCNETICKTCKIGFIMDQSDNCFLDFQPKSDDYCKVITQEINDDIGQIDFEKLIEYYFQNIYSYLNTVIRYMNKNYTLTMLINSDCTESLLEQGYFKIDSKELNNIITEEVGLDLIRHEFLFHFFIEYDNKNHYRVYDFNSKYVAPKINCIKCVDMPFILTYKYSNTVNIILGPILSSTIVLEQVDIFSKDSEIFTDLCQNVTLEGVDIPLNERLHYLYFGEYSTQIACGGDNCELVEINKEESTSTCRCKLNEYEDLFKEIEIKNTENQEIESSSSESFGILKCAKNGFNAHNIRSNGGFYICLIIIVAVGVLILCYFLCSKIITTSEKGFNPPSKIKNRLKIVSNWDKTEAEKKK